MNKASAISCKRLTAPSYLADVKRFTVFCLLFYQNAVKFSFLLTVRVEEADQAGASTLHDMRGWFRHGEHLRIFAPLFCFRFGHEPFTAQQFVTPSPICDRVDGEIFHDAPKSLLPVRCSYSSLA